MDTAVNWATVCVAMLAALVPTAGALISAARWQGATDVTLKALEHRLSRIETFLNGRLAAVIARED